MLGKFWDCLSPALFRTHCKSRFLEILFFALTQPFWFSVDLVLAIPLLVLSFCGSEARAFSDKIYHVLRGQTRGPLFSWSYNFARNSWTTFQNFLVECVKLSVFTVKDLYWKVHFFLATIPERIWKPKMSVKPADYGEESGESVEMQV